MRSRKETHQKRISFLFFVAIQNFIIGKREIPLLQCDISYDKS